MKREIILILMVALPLIFNGCAQQDSKAIHVSKIQEPSYLNLTNKMDKYASLKEAIKMTNGQADVQLSVDQFFEVRKLIGGSDYVRINDITYKIHLTRGAEGSKVYNPENYTTVSREELENYTLIKNIIISIIENEQEVKHGEHYPTYIAIQFYGSPGELRKATEFVRERGNVVKFEEEYYKVIVDTSLRLSKYQSPICMQVAHEKLEKYPKLRRALEQASENGSSSISTSPEEWEEISGFVKGDCVSYNGTNYKVSFVT